MDAREAAIESDRRYYEIGAERMRLPAADIVWMPALAATPMGALAQRIDATRLPDALAAIEARLQVCGARRARLYLDAAYPEADQALAAAGYQRRAESLYAGCSKEACAIEIAAVTREADWQAKLALHRAAGIALEMPVAAADWVAFERRKAQAGGFGCWLVRQRGETVATFGTIAIGRRLRLKNLVVDSRHRRRGIGRQVLGWASRRGEEVLAIALTGQHRFYEQVGFGRVGEQWEFVRTL
ncbi:MAG: GNAT family N-acetyltransferase [Sphingosinicella sp.]